MIVGINKDGQNQIKLPIDNYANKLIWYMKTYLDKLRFDTQSLSEKANEKAKIGLKWFIFPNEKEFERDFHR